MDGSHIEQVIGFIRLHSEWTGPIIFLVAFGESFAFLSLLVPGTAIMIAAGALVPEGIIPVAPLILGGIAGATLGDGISYWLGRRFGHVVPGMWPFSKRPELLRSGHEFFARHGGKSIFIGRFFGPVRAVVPLVAGMMDMPAHRFWLANIASALIWAPMLTLPGIFAVSAWKMIDQEEGWWPLLLFAGVMAALVVLWLGWTYRNGKR